MKKNLSNKSSKETLESEFITNYLKLGFGGLSKRDTDALVMYLLEKYGFENHGPLNKYSNQEASALLKVPVTKVKQLRYEAALKFGGQIEAQAKKRLLEALSRAALEIESHKICFILEDSLVRNWLQGQLKANGLMFDHSFNSEIVKIDAAGFFKLLNILFSNEVTGKFKKDYDELLKIQNKEKFSVGLLKIVKDFAIAVIPTLLL